MFNFMIKHKKGFTLVELMIVVAIMGFGVVALGNLFQYAIRTFNKTEERYIKQEAVKAVAESLQSYTNITIATKAELYADSSVVPTVAGADLSYTYIYIEQTEAKDGYYLYRLDRGMKKDDAVCLNPETPLYIQFNAYKDSDKPIPEGLNEDEMEAFLKANPIKNQCGIKVTIGAVDNDFEYKDTYTDADGKAITEQEAIADYIFYDTTVSYHFPNMVANRDKIRVNVMYIDKNGKLDPGEEEDGVVRDKANVYNDDGLVIAGTDASGKTIYQTADSVDEDAKVLRVTYDTNITGEDVTVPISVSSFCFIATAGYGEATGEVGILCDFRDQCLKTNPLGRMFVKAYYMVSPPIADFIAESEPLKAATRVALKPLVAFAVYALEPELLIDQLPFVIMGLSSVVGLGAFVIVHKKKTRLA